MISFISNFRKIIYYSKPTMCIPVFFVFVVFIFNLYESFLALCLSHDYWIVFVSAEAQDEHLVFLIWQWQDVCNSTPPMLNLGAVEFLSLRWLLVQVCGWWLRGHVALGLGALGCLKKIINIYFVASLRTFSLGNLRLPAEKQMNSRQKSSQNIAPNITVRHINSVKQVINWKPKYRHKLGPSFKGHLYFW